MKFISEWIKLVSIYFRNTLSIVVYLSELILGREDFFMGVCFLETIFSSRIPLSLLIFKTLVDFFMLPSWWFDSRDVRKETWLKVLAKLESLWRMVELMELRIELFLSVTITEEWKESFSWSFFKESPSTILYLEGCNCLFFRLRSPSKLLLIYITPSVLKINIT